MSGMSHLLTSGSKQCGCGRTISANALQCLACREAQPQTPRGSGVLEILNVQGGDVKITFEKGDVAETIRARRIVTDMLRRGYALVVEIERDGEKKYERIQQFDEARGEYIVADFDPVEAQQADEKQKVREAKERQAMYEKDYAADPNNISAPAPDPPADPALCHCGRPKGHRGAHQKKSTRLPMETTRATAIGRSAGG
jgi:hypothetical protein